MDFTASNGAAGGSYERPKPGNYTGVLIGFSDMGTHSGQYGMKRRVMLRWELHKKKGPVLDAEGNVLTTTAMYNASFDVKSSLRPVIEAHVGEIKDGDRSSSKDWLGHAAKLILKESDDGKYTNVDKVFPLDPEEDETPKRIEALEHWELEDGTPPPKWVKYMLERSEEWKRTNAKAKVPVGAGVGSDDDEDRVPF